MNVEAIVPSGRRIGFKLVTRGRVHEYRFAGWITRLYRFLVLRPEYNPLNFHRRHGGAPPAFVGLSILLKSWARSRQQASVPGIRRLIWLLWTVWALRWIFGQIGKAVISLFRPAIKRVQAPKIPRRKSACSWRCRTRGTSSGCRKHRRDDLNAAYRRAAKRVAPGSEEGGESSYRPSIRRGMC